MVRLDLAGVEQASKQGILGARNRMKRAGAVERISDLQLLRSRSAAANDFHIEAIIIFARIDNTASENLEPALRDHPRNRVGNLRRDAVPVNIPPWAGMAQESALLLHIQALP